MRQRLYSESSFDLPEESFGPQPSRQDNVNQSKAGFGQQVHRQASIKESHVSLNLPHTYLGRPAATDRENQVVSQGPMIFVNKV